METTTEIVTPEWKKDSSNRYRYNIDALNKKNHHIFIKDANNDVVLELCTSLNNISCYFTKIQGYAGLVDDMGKHLAISEVEFLKKHEALQKLTIIKNMYRHAPMTFYYHDKQLKEHQELIKEHQEAIKELQSTIDIIKFQNKYLVETVDALSRRISGLEEEVQELQPEVFVTPLGQQVKDVSNVGTITDTTVCTSVETQVQEPVETKKSSTEHVSSYVVEDSSMVVVTTEPRKATWYKVFGDY